MAAKTMTIDEFAIMIDANPRAIRKVLRAKVPAEMQPGRGGRWTIAEKDIEKVSNWVASARANSAPVDLSDIE